MQVTRDTGKKRAADSDVLQSMVSTTKSMRSYSGVSLFFFYFVVSFSIFHLRFSFLLDFMLNRFYPRLI